MELSRQAARRHRRIKTTRKAIRKLLLLLLVLVPSLYLLASQVQALVTAPPLLEPPAETTPPGVSRPTPTTKPPAPGSRTSRSPAPEKPDLAPLNRSITRLLGNDLPHYGIYVVDLKSGVATGVNENTRFSAASTVKLPLAMFVLEQAHQGGVSLDEKITYTNDDYEDGTGVLQGTPPGTEFSTGDLVKLAITKSDNIAANMLLRRFGRDAVAAYTRTLGGDAILFDGDNLVTPKDMSFYLRRLMQVKYISRKTRDLLLDYLTHTEFNDRLPGGLPPRVRIAHKIGTLPGVVNDVGIVFAPQRTYIISVMSRDVSEDDATQMISAVSRTVYQFEVQPPNPSDAAR